MTHKESAERRLHLAREVADGSDSAEVARRHRVSVDQVHKACREHGVPVVPLNRGRVVQTMRMIALLQNTDKTITAIAEELRWDFQYVSSLYRMAQDAGIRIPTRSGGRPRSK